MMNTPICDFIDSYIKSNALRLHMPGHKGVCFSGYEGFDITEITGADSLYGASGIIKESEKNASAVFGADTFYSTEGSSLCIRAMVCLAKTYGCEKIYASRNAHKAFISACALNGTEPIWIYSENRSYLSGDIDTEALDAALENEKCKTAVYITSPDYLGGTADIKAISEICRRRGALLMVDNAHGAYLKFMPEPTHPIDLGADICCDSAHKTLPVLTGGAYLHISKNAPAFFSANAKNALSLFGSTSPSYLILRSLDAANRYISDGYPKRLAEFVPTVGKAKERIASRGFEVIGGEALKIVIKPKKYGYLGTELANELENRNIFCEFADRDHTVFMLTPENGEEAVDMLVSALCGIERREPIREAPPKLCRAERVLTVREAVFAVHETVNASESEGRVLAQFNIACPPAVPILVCGERISREAVECFGYYGTEEVEVIKNTPTEK